MIHLETVRDLDLITRHYVTLVFNSMFLDHSDYLSHKESVLGSTPQKSQSTVMK